MTPDPTTFATRLRALRESQKLSASALAKAARVSRQTVSQLELGPSLPSWETIQKLADGLKVSIDEFR